MRGNFKDAVEFTLRWEGGYSNNLNDPGGETNYGISKRVYQNLDIKNLTREGAIAIYRHDYWNVCGCDDMPSPLDMAVFDTAVNCGVNRAMKWYRDCKGDYKALLLYRIKHYTDLCNKDGKYRTFIVGWLNRTMDLWRVCMGLLTPPNPLLNKREGDTTTH